MVGLQSLDLPIGVRIPVSQPIIFIRLKGNQAFYTRLDYPLIISVLSIINVLSL
jgi:hypothetical protein